MVPGTLAFTLGIYLCMQLRTLPDPVWAGFVPLLLLLATNRQWRIKALFILGFLWTQLYAINALQARLPQNFEGRDLLVSGTVRGVPRSLQGKASNTSVRQQFLFSMESSSPHWSRQFYGTCVLRLTWYRHRQGLQAGSRWRFQVRLKRPRGSHNSDSFDRELNALRNGICATGYIRTRKMDPVRLLTADSASLSGYRQRLVDRLRHRLSGFVSSGIIIALLTGVRDDINADQRNTLQTTGTAHLVAISGLHIGLVAGFGFLLGGTINRLLVPVLPVFAPGRLEAVLALVMASVYSALAGFSLPTQRALIMLLVALLATRLGRRIATSTAFCWALILVLLIEPLAATNAGLWLSFCAVAGLLYGLSDRRCQRLCKRGSTVGALVKVQLIAWITLIPVGLYWFGGVSLASPVANLIAVPVTAMVVVPLVLFAALIDSLGWSAMAGELLEMGATVMDLLLLVLQVIEDFVPLLHLPVPVPGVLFVCGTIAIALMLLPASFRLRWLGGIWLLPVVIPISTTPERGSYWLTVYDVGQGLATSLRTQHHSLVYDTGPGLKNGWDAGTRIVAPQLLREGVRDLDQLVLSHRHQDHIGGTGGIMRSLRVRRLTTNVPSRYLPGGFSRQATFRCQQGMVWRWDGIEFSILSPPRESIGRISVNNASCVLRVRGPGGETIFTGDIERETELQLARGVLSKSASHHGNKVLLAAHHGSKTSSSAQFLDAVEPGWVIISRGYANRFKFPHPQVQQRYRDRNIKIIDTTCQGAIQVRFGPQSGRVQMTTWRDHKARFWHIFGDTRCLWNTPQGFDKVSG